MQFVAVTFGGMDLTAREIRFVDEKPYFYLDPLDLKVKDFALVHSQDGWGIVRIERAFTTQESNVVGRVTQSLLAKVDYNSELIRECYRRIKQFKDETQNLRIQGNIDAELSGVTIEAPPRRKKRIGVLSGGIEYETETPF